MAEWCTYKNLLPWNRFYSKVMHEWIFFYSTIKLITWCQIEVLLILFHTCICRSPYIRRAGDKTNLNIWYSIKGRYHLHFIIPSPAAVFPEDLSEQRKELTQAEFPKGPQKLLYSRSAQKTSANLCRYSAVTYERFLAAKGFSHSLQTEPDGMISLLTADIHPNLA